MRDEMTKFQKAGIRPFGVNPAGLESHVRYVEKFKFNFPLLTDPDRAAAKAYHAVKEDGQGILRTVYVVGRDGTVKFAMRGTPAVDDIVAALSAK